MQKKFAAAHGANETADDAAMDEDTAEAEDADSAEDVDSAKISRKLKMLRNLQMKMILRTMKTQMRQKMSKIQKTLPLL